MTRVGDDEDAAGAAVPADRDRGPAASRLRPPSTAASCSSARSGSAALGEQPRGRPTEHVAALDAAPDPERPVGWSAKSADRCGTVGPMRRLVPAADDGAGDRVLGGRLDGGGDRRTSALVLAGRHDDVDQRSSGRW